MIAGIKIVLVTLKNSHFLFFVRIVFCEVGCLGTILQFSNVLVGEGLFVKEVNSVTIEPLVCNYLQVQ